MDFLQKFLIILLPVLFAITLHEVAHGWIASKCGDLTAKRAGRLTLNPLNHIDLIGTVVVPIVMFVMVGFIFGWAKPVPVNWNNLRHPKRDMALVALAGPFSNLLMALFWAGIVKTVLLFGEPQSGPTLALVYMGKVGITINLLLMIFNLFPLPPLDGSRVVSALLPTRLAWQYNKIEPFGLLILLVFLALGWIGYLVWPPLMVMESLITTLFRF